MRNNEKINLENAANTPIIKDLKSLLNTLTVEELKYIGKLFILNRLSNKKKKELVEIIYNELTNKESLSNIINRMIDKEFNLLKQLMKNKGIVQNNYIDIEEYHYLYMTGIAFLFRRNNKFYVSMTDDVYNTIKKIDLSHFEKTVAENTKSYNLLRAMVELYGVVSEDDFIDSYCEYYDHTDYLDIPPETLYFCNRIDRIYRMHTQYNCYYMASILCSKEYEFIVGEIIQRQLEIKRKPITLDELLKYDDYYSYEENTSITKFKNYLATKNVSKNIIEEIIIYVITIFKLGHSHIDIVLAMLEDHGIEINEHNIQIIINYLINIFNNTRVWVNNGWTPIELKDSQLESNLNMENESMNYKNYIVKKGKTDLLSSLKAINNKTINKSLKEKALDNIQKLKDYIIDTFESCLDNAKDDMFTKIYFQTLIDNENSEVISAHDSDIEDYFVFIYKNGDYYSYYIADEIKKLIKKILKI